MNEEILLSWVDKTFIPNLPECEQLREHVNQIIKTLLAMNNDETLLELEDYDDLPNLVLDSVDLFNNRLSKIFIGFGLSVNDAKAFRKIKTHGLLYIGYSIARNYGIAMTGIRKRIKAIEQASLKLNELLKSDAELIAILASLSISELKPRHESGFRVSETSDPFKIFEGLSIEKVGKLKLELQHLIELETLFKNSILGSWLQYGRSGPKTNSALIFWVQEMAETWTNHFGRKLSFSNNPHAGREKFLQFSEACFSEIHPTLLNSQPDAIRNAFEKLRVKGAFGD